MTVLVTGGAGYIGSHAVRELRSNGWGVVVIDSLFRGHREAVPAGVPFYDVPLAEAERLARIMREHRVEAVMHFAALAYVGESVAQPLVYYENNTTGTVRLLQAMQAAGVKRMVFSSTCATYGVPETVPLVETMPQRPINPYGWSKLFIEQILKDQAAADSEFGFVALRYFNVAGCAGDGSLGEDHEPETHLIPVILKTALGQRDAVTVFGTDYPTPDGTCIRDYIHVEDLCAAHLAALRSLAPGDQRFYNLGIGRGYSVREVVDAAKRVTGREIRLEYGERRAGDPPVLYANADKIRRELDWAPRFTEIDPIVETAWRWFREHPDGYRHGERAIGGGDDESSGWVENRSRAQRCEE